MIKNITPKGLLRLLVEPLLHPQSPNGVVISTSSGRLIVTATVANAGRIIGKQGTSIKAIQTLMAPFAPHVSAGEMPDNRVSSEPPKGCPLSIQGIAELYLTLRFGTNWKVGPSRRPDSIDYFVRKSDYSVELETALNSWGWRAARGRDQSFKIYLTPDDT